MDSLVKKRDSVYILFIKDSSTFNVYSTHKNNILHLDVMYKVPSTRTYKRMPRRAIKCF